MLFSCTRTDVMFSSTCPGAVQILTQFSRAGDGQIIFDNFAKILKQCLKELPGKQEIPDLVNDTRMIWEMCLKAELEVGPSPRTHACT